MVILVVLDRQTVVAAGAHLSSRHYGCLAEVILDTFRESIYVVRERDGM